MDAKQYPIQKVMTPAEFEEAKVKLAAEQHFNIDAPYGNVNIHGVHIDYGYDGSVLGINVLSTPPFMRGHVEHAIKQALGLAL